MYIIPLAKANPARLAGQASDMFFRCSTVRASRAIRPKQRFDMRESGLFIVEMGCTQNSVCHGVTPYLERLPLVVGVVKCNTADRNSRSGRVSPELHRRRSDYRAAAGGEKSLVFRR